MKQSIESKTGNADVKQIGHTYSGVHGSEPNASVRGRPNEPTEQKFGK